MSKNFFYTDKNKKAWNLPCLHSGFHAYPIQQVKPCALRRHLGMKNKKHIRDSSVASLLRNDGRFFERERLCCGEAAAQPYIPLFVSCHSERSEESHQLQVINFSFLTTVMNYEFLNFKAIQLLSDRNASVRRQKRIRRRIDAHLFSDGSASIFRYFRIRLTKSTDKVFGKYKTCLADGFFE